MLNEAASRETVGSVRGGEEASQRPVRLGCLRVLRRAGPQQALRRLSCSAPRICLRQLQAVRQGERSFARSFAELGNRVAYEPFGEQQFCPAHLQGGLPK